MPSKQKGFGPIFATIIILLVAGVGIWFIAQRNDDKSQNYDFNFSEGQSEDPYLVLAEIEKQMPLALQSGGIHPDTYKEINDKLDALEAVGVDKDRINAVRASLAQLEVGGSEHESTASSVNNQQSAPTSQKSS